MTENFIKLMPGTKQHMQETQRTPSRKYSKTSTLRHIIFKLQKIKDKGKILKEGREKKNQQLGLHQIQNLLQRNSSIN